MSRATEARVNPIHAVFERLQRRGELALIPYLTAGYPDRATFGRCLRTISDAGADLIEIGVPFSDPIADGATIQHASHVALQCGARLRDLLADLQDIRLPQPLVFMSYLNPLLAIGMPALMRAMNDAHVHALIVPDLPVEESDEWVEAARAHAIHMVFLAAPNSPPQRIREIGRRSDGFVYAVSLTGTTGVRSAMDASLPGFLDAVRRETGRPAAVGFGVSGPEVIRTFHGHADGVVVGSRIVQAIRDGEDLAGLVGALKQATIQSAE